MKVMLFCGSPHAQGCTYTALSRVADVLHANQVETQMVQLGTRPLMGCTGCGHCKKGGEGCVIDDDVNQVIADMNQCDGLIIGSPVYYAAPNGALTAFLDRMFYAGAKGFAHKPGACLVSARRAGTTAALDQLNKYFLISQMPLVPSFYWNMVHGNTPQEVLQDAEGLQIMEALGANMAWMLKSIAAAKNAGIEPPAPVKRVRTNFIR